MPRPSKLTETAHVKIVAAIARGARLEAAAAAGGVAISTLRSWLARGRSAPDSPFARLLRDVQSARAGTWRPRGGVCDETIFYDGRGKAFRRTADGLVVAVGLDGSSFVRLSFKGPRRFPPSTTDFTEGDWRDLAERYAAAPPRRSKVVPIESRR